MVNTKECKLKWGSRCLDDCKRIGIYPGTYDPPHISHALIAQEAAYEANLDVVFFVITPHNYMKDEPFVKDFHRYEMLKEMTMRMDSGVFLADACESIRKDKTGETTYTIDTLKDFRNRFPDGELFLIMGGDSFHQIHNWKDVTEFKNYCSLLVFQRGRYNYNEILRDISFNKKLFSDNIKTEILDFVPPNISSTEIRKRLTKNEPVSHLLYPHVLEKIYYMKHYGCDYPSAEKVK